jgi:hypothetical protein
MRCFASFRYLQLRGVHREERTPDQQLNVKQIQRRQVIPAQQDHGRTHLGIDART